MRKTGNRESFLSSLGSSVLWKSLDKGTGLLKHILIAGTIGLSAQLDVFYMAHALLGVLIFSWGGLLEVLAVPRMVELARKARWAAYRALTGGFFSLCLIISLVLTAVVLLAPGPVASLALGFEEHRGQLLKEAFPWLLPVMLLLIPTRFLGSVLRAARNFSIYYQSEFLASLVILACVWFHRDDPHVLLWSLSLGTGLAFVYLLLRAPAARVRPASPLGQEVLERREMASGLLVLQGVHYVFILMNRVFVSFLPSGGVAALAYGHTLTVLFPRLPGLSGAFLTVLSEKKDRRARSASLNDLLSLCLFFSAGVAAYLILFGRDLVRILLERGVFTGQDTEQVALALKGYAWMIPPLLVVGILDDVFQVEKRIGLMVRRALLGLGIGAGLNAWFLFGLGWGLWGVALSATLGYWVMLAAGLEGVARIGYRIQWIRHLKWAAWIAAWTAGLALLSDWGTIERLPAFPRAVGGVLACAGALLACGWSYRGAEGALVRSTLGRLAAGLRRRTVGSLR